MAVVLTNIPHEPKSLKISKQSEFSLKQNRLTGTNGFYHNVHELIFDYRILTLISEQFNHWVSYKIVFLHACGYCQFISDVFVAMQVLKMEGTGFWDVW